jgi:hypothetical protein
VGNQDYFQALGNFIVQGVAKCQGKIEDGDKHPYRKLFEVLVEYVKTGANTVLETQSRQCAQEALNVLLMGRLVDNAQNERMMKEFGESNNDEIECFREMFERVP